MSKMNTAADRDRRQLVGATRGRDLYWGFTIGVFANLVTLYLIIQGGDLPQLAMTAAIVGIFVFVMINSFDCMDDFKANVDDMDEEEAATNLGQKFKAALGFIQSRNHTYFWRYCNYSAYGGLVKNSYYRALSFESC